MTEITHHRDGDKGRFELTFEGKPAGKMEYIAAADNKITITHTEIHSSFSGNGLGSQLVQAGVDYARENSLKIVPACSFARHILEKDASYKDVLSE